MSWWPFNKKVRNSAGREKQQAFNVPANYPMNWWQLDWPNPGSGSGDCPTVQACIDAYAQTLASLPVRHERIEDDGSKTPLRRSRINKLLQKPNFYQTRSDFFLNLTAQLMSEGEAFALAGRNGQFLVNALHPVTAQGTVPYVDPMSREVFYGMGENPLLGKMDAMIPARDVLHIRLHTPRHPLIGEPPVKHCLMAKTANQAIASQQAAFFSNSSRPSGFISVRHDIEGKVLTREQIQQFIDCWEAQSRKFNAGGVPVLPGNMNWHQLAISSQDAQLADAFNMTVEEIARAFRVPLPLVGDNRNSTYNNVEQLLASWLATGLGFVMEHIEIALAQFLALPDDEKIEFDTDNLLRTDFQGKIEALGKGVISGIFSPNEARAKLGLKRVKAGDEPRVQQQVVPLSAWNQPAPAPAPVPVPVTEPEEVSE